MHLAKSTLCEWVAQAADLREPIADAMAKAMLSAHRIHTDDTGIAVLAKGSTQKGHVLALSPKYWKQAKDFNAARDLAAAG